MKKILSTLFVLSLALTVSAQTMRVAILETVDKEGNVPYFSKLMLRANLSKAITNTPGFETYDRTDIDAILGEQNFQRTGMVSNDQIKRLGEMTGANYVLVAEAVMAEDKESMFITAKILDVETARTILTDNTIMGTSPNSMQDGCITLAERMFISKNLGQKKTTVSTPKQAESTYSTIYQVNQNINQVSQNVPSSEPKMQYTSLSPIIRNGRNSYTMGNVHMNEVQVLLFFQQNCPSAYKDMMIGRQCKAVGWGFFAGGAASIIVGPLVGYEAGAAMIATGSIFLGASVVLLPIGYVKVNKAHNRYNNECANKMALNIIGGNDGIGLALSF